MINLTKLKGTPFRDIFLWILFLPIGGVLIGLAQVIATTVAETYTWQQSAVWIVIFGGAFVGAGVIPTMVALNRKVGASVLLTLFVFFEGSALVSTFSEMQVYPFIVRLYVDFAVMVGAIAGALIKGADGEHPA